MLKKTMIVLVAVLAVLAAVVAAQPSDFKITRTATMDAPASVIFNQVNDFHLWQAWSPWAKLDPKANIAYEGPDSGPGAIFKWTGNDEIGEGQMTITDSHPSDRIVIRLEFIKPFAGVSTSEFTFQPEGENTRVRWRMSGQKDFLSKAMGLVMNCDQMVGGQFEKGLAAMKTVVETQK